MVYHGGGLNRAHDSVAICDRLNSFQIGPLRGVYAVLWDSGGHIVLDCPGDWVDLFYSINIPPDRLELSRVANHYGGERTYFLCPDCGRRVRFLYRPHGQGLFQCRHCWSLNYPTQQERPSEIGAYQQGVKLLRERFKVPEEQMPKMEKFGDFCPARPKWMHWRNYMELRQQLEILQGTYFLYEYIRSHRVGKRILWTDEAEAEYEEKLLGE